MLLLIASAAWLSGCAASTPPPPAEAPIVLAPLPPVLPPTASASVSRALKHDSAAVAARARALIAPPSTTAETVATLAPLTRHMNRALAVMELHHSARGYRQSDVRATRAAADAVAHFLDTQAPTRAAEAPRDEPPGVEKLAP